MRTIRTALAIARLAVTDTRPATHHAYVRLTGNTKETPRFRRYNNAVAAALLDPYLPARLREPADLAH